MMMFRSHVSLPEGNFCIQFDVVSFYPKLERLQLCDGEVTTVLCKLSSQGIPAIAVGGPGRQLDLNWFQLRRKCDRRAPVGDGWTHQSGDFVFFLALDVLHQMKLHVRFCKVLKSAFDCFLICHFLSLLSHTHCLAHMFCWHDVETIQNLETWLTQWQVFRLFVPFVKFWCRPKGDGGIMSPHSALDSWELWIHFQHVTCHVKIEDHIERFE